MREEGFADIYVKTRGMSVRIPGTFAGKQAELFAFLKDFWPEDNHRLTGVDTGLKTHPVLSLQGGLALFTPQRRRGCPRSPICQAGVWDLTIPAAAHLRTQERQPENKLFSSKP